MECGYGCPCFDMEWEKWRRGWCESYIDGNPAQEKAPTIANRADRRQKALESTTVKLQELEIRINDGLRVRKHHFKDVCKGMCSAFYWSMDARRAFADYMTKHGWVVVNCTTEADLAIVQACLPTDIVLSRDSDMLYYASIRTIWQPISKGRVLVYDVREVMATLGLNQAQFTVLGMVSRNDYNRNIPSLGSATNYTIVKELKEQGKRNSMILCKWDPFFLFPIRPDCTSWKLFATRKGCS